MSQNSQYTPTEYKHIYLNTKGQPVIGKTRMKVRFIAGEYTHWKWSPEAIQMQHDFLSLAEIHSALAYYFDHQTEIDAVIQQDEELADAMREAAGPSLLEQRLQAAGVL